MLHSKMLPGEQNAPFREQNAPPREQNAPLGEQNAPLGAFCYAFCYARSILLPGEHFAMPGAFCSLGSKMLCHSKMLIAKCFPGGAFCYREEQNAPMGAICSPGSILLWSKMLPFESKMLPLGSKMLPERLPYGDHRFWRQCLARATSRQSRA